jgi:tRNA 2-thiouridine synthesizing protein B
MSTLHTVNKSPFSTQTLISCLGHARNGDTVLLIEDGVLGASAGSGMADLISARMKTVRVCALEPDLAARGIGASRTLEGIETIDYSGFVDLAASHDRTQAWL